jgi:hypothetical protein
MILPSPQRSRPCWSCRLCHFGLFLAVSVLGLEGPLPLRAAPRFDRQSQSLTGLPNAATLAAWLMERQFLPTR